MKKHIKIYHLGRDKDARKALFRGLIKDLIINEKIKTTKAKVAATKPIFEKLLTKAKLGSVAKIREIHSFIPDNQIVSKLVHEIAPRYKDIKGGYTKVAPYGTRRGDNAEIVTWSLTKLKEVAAKKPADQPKQAQLAEPKPKAATKKITASAPVAKTAKTSVKIAPSRAGKRGDK